MNKTSEGAISDQSILEELARILKSPIFAQSDRLARFLRFTIDQAISGNKDALKEYAIGTEVYDRKPPYHPSQDSIVRTEARRLRSKLKEYYETEGQNDPMFIYFRPGSYIPVFRSRDTLDHERPAELFIDLPGVPIAVIPFANLSNSPISESCARGITDELVHELSRTDGCRVIAMSSIAQPGLQVSDIPALAQKLGVQIVFEGTVREEGGRIRVTARIVNADAFQLWSQRFEAEADPASLFKVQEQIASALISRVAPQQSVIRKGKASAGPSILAVYPATLAAEALLDQGTVADVRAALTKFEEVTKAAPGYARPYCGIAQCYYWMALRGTPHSADLASHAKKAALHAMELDPQMIEAHSTLGGALTLEWDWSGAEASFIQALSLGTHAPTYRQYAIYLTALERFDEAWLYLQYAQQIDPFSYRQKVASARFFFLSRRYDEGLDYVVTSVADAALPLEVRLYQALTYIKLGRHDDAKNMAQSLLRSVGAQPALRACLAEIFALCGEKSLADKTTAEFNLLSPAAPISKFRQVLLSIASGNPKAALSLLSEAYADKEAEMPWLAVDPRFDSISKTTQCSEMIRDVRLGISS